MAWHWYAGPWVWDAAAAPAHWRPPAGLGGLDLRPLPEQAVAGGTPGVGLFFGPVAPADLESRADYRHLGEGSWHDIRPPAAVRARIPRRKGYEPRGDDLVGILLDVLTDGADPDGLDGPMPLVPTAAGRLELHCGGLRHHERFRWGAGHYALIRHGLRRQFAGLWARDARLARKCLDYWCEKYRVEDWADLVPPDLRPDVPGRLPHDTTITESFNTADSSTLGPDLSWTEYSNNTATDRWSVVSNQARVSTKSNTNLAAARADSDLSGSDNYAQVNLTTNGSGSENKQIGACCRFSSSDNTCYVARAVRAGLNDFRLDKCVSGTMTGIGGPTAITITPPFTVKAEASGSTIKGYRAGVEQLSVTDTAITSGTRAGVFGFSTSSEAGNAECDSFEAGDLAASGLVYTQLERGTRGMLRGVYTGRP